MYMTLLSEFEKICNKAFSFIILFIIKFSQGQSRKWEEISTSWSKCREKGRNRLRDTLYNHLIPGKMSDKLCSW